MSMNSKRSILDFLRIGLAPSLLQPAAMAAQDGVNADVLLTQDDSGNKRTVRAGRRRTSGSTEPGPRERAEAPSREQPSAAPPPPRPPSGGGASRPPAASQPAGLPRSPLLIIGLLLLLVVCGVPILLLTGGGDSGDSTTQPEAFPVVEEPVLAPTPTTPAIVAAKPTPTRRPAATLTSSSSASGDTWLIMLYQDADDKILEQDIYVDLNEAERTGSSDKIKIVTQVDRYRGGYQGDGNWTSTKRFYVTQDNDLSRVGSELVADLGEANMADGDTLVDFATWAIETYPADKVVLIMSDHGMGWPGGWSDPTSNSRGDSRVPLSSALGDQLYLNEIDAALEEIRARTGLEKFEMVGMDACLMGHLEVFTMLAPHARYAVASQETEPALGWAYTGFLDDLQANPGMSGAELGRIIVESYIEEDQRIVDDQARAEFVGGGSPRGGMFGGPTAAQITAQLGRNITLTAVDLGQLPALTASTNNLAFTLQSASQEIVAQARSYAQSFTSIFGKQVPASYIDLGHFAQLAAQNSRNNAVAQATNQLMAALDAAVIAEKHGPNKSGATGVSIYFPTSQLYGNPAAGPQSYTVAAERFARESLWDDFLAFHYTGRQFEATASDIAVPERGESVTAPGAGDFTVSALTLSSDVAAPGEPVLMSADISGENIGYVRLFVGYFDQTANSIYVADTDYLDSPETRELNGVYYPDWGEGDFTLEFEWEPIVFAITDGADSFVTLFTPEEYGKTREQAVYSVDGIYTYIDGESRNARLYFQNGVLRQVFGFTGDSTTGAPREIIPEAGDRFTILENWIDLDQSGKVTQTATQQGATLTFGDKPFTWKELDAAIGDYVIGYIVEDLDGNSTATYGQVTVQ
jgi:hypothetical protein